MSDLSQLEREINRILPQIRRLELISVDSAAKLLGKSPKFVRANLPIIATGPRSQRVRRVDVEAFLERRTIYPAPKLRKPRRLKVLREVAA